ncbi:MAG: polysaccharide pyruvyl transferase family protein [Candidatus Saccharibacteria bacterium]|nr:polysaccharide pyruvyl transferase family protein [Candidatus Saccharibacteria bacterium]
MRTLIVSNRLDPFNGNLGDFASDPSLYFPWLANARRVQLDRLGARIIPTPSLKSHNVIVGGGGLIGTELALFRRGFERVLEQTDLSLSVIWGAGFNTHLEEPADQPHDLYALLKELDRFALVGLRDAGLAEARYVPCPSVMMSALTRNYDIEQKAVVYDNWQFPWKDGDKKLPQMNNNRRFRSSNAKQKAVYEVIAFLGSAEVVLTSTYHGALWATMLGKKVVVTRPFSTKFEHFRYPPVVLEQNESWKDAAARACVYPRALHESRQLTEGFAAEVRELFSQ